MTRRVAAIDCGTNSTRLLVADATGRPLTRQMRITRLGEGVDAEGRLSPAAIDRCLSVLGDFRGDMDDVGIDARVIGRWRDRASMQGVEPEADRRRDDR